ncbi:hypothetical protein [Streptomyces sp. 5-10]|uniref:hypothetical protein n=1 Tax=Streptomyces sp. 5-10 TaxID=878925 RepID=UPI00168B777C|nr:hypothetical protein [Streptomyces sp. 5-10]MBD3004640.1 hypothetical protein [Streptomyces sp. 5-10]
MHWSEIPDGVIPTVEQRGDIQTPGVKKTGEGRTVVLMGVAPLDGSDLLVLVPEDDLNGDRLVLNEDQAKAVFRRLMVVLRSWGCAEYLTSFDEGYEQALMDAANAIEDPDERNKVGGDPGWETVMKVVDGMLQDFRKKGNR